MNDMELGASLYVPAISPDLLEIANGKKFQLRSVIFCTEDSIHPEQVDFAIDNLKQTLPHFQNVQRLRFIRVRNPDVMHQLLKAKGIEKIDGFVIPKATRSNLPDYIKLLGERHSFFLMPTLETADVFDACEMKKLRQFLLTDAIRPHLLSLRIGGNDLMNILGMRRPLETTIYDSPLREVISQLVGTFKPYGFNLTAPVFEGLAHTRVLQKEVELDLAYGLFGKTAIHPQQVPIIESAYAVREDDLKMALGILIDDAPAVFRMNDTMCELATHRNWATIILQRSKIYGILGKDSQIRETVVDNLLRDRF